MVRILLFSLSLVFISFFTGCQGELKLGKGSGNSLDLNSLLPPIVVAVPVLPDPGDGGGAGRRLRRRRGGRRPGAAGDRRRRRWPLHR